MADYKAIQLSAIYEKGNMRNVDKDGDGKDDHLQLKLVNKVGSGSVTVDLKVSVDGVEMTEASTLQINDRPPERVRPSMAIHSDYGDTIVLEVKHDGKIGPGSHKVSLQAMVDWQTYSQDIEDSIQ